MITKENLNENIEAIKETIFRSIESSFQILICQLKNTVIISVDSNGFFVLILNYFFTTFLVTSNFSM